MQTFFVRGLFPKMGEGSYLLFVSAYKQILDENKRKTHLNALIIFRFS